MKRSFSFLAVKVREFNSPSKSNLPPSWNFYAEEGHLSVRKVYDYYWNLISASTYWESWGLALQEWSVAAYICFLGLCLTLKAE